MRHSTRDGSVADYNLISKGDRRQRHGKNSILSLAEDHLLRVILVFRYGEPRIEEPLALAYRRALSKLEVNEVSSLNHMRRILEEEPPAGDIKSKISTSVRHMPYWLRYRCCADWSMQLLGLKIPSLPKQVIKPAPTKSDRGAWPLPPQRIFEPRPDDDEPYRFVKEPSLKELIRYLTIMKKPEEEWTPREHKFIEAIETRMHLTRWI
jgi:hypothetical protein